MGDLRQDLRKRVIEAVALPTKSKSLMHRLPWRFCAWIPPGEKTAPDSVGEQTESPSDTFLFRALASHFRDRFLSPYDGLASAGRGRRGSTSAL
jgi:hypothetical protein